MSLPDAMVGLAHGINLHTYVAAEVLALPGRMFKKIERELVKGQARQRAGKTAATRKMRIIINSHLLTQDQASQADAMQGVKKTPTQPPGPQSELEQAEEFKFPEVKLTILHASKIKKHKGRKAKNSCFSPPTPPNAPIPVQSLRAPPAAAAPPLTSPPPQTSTVASASELERKLARLRAELQQQNRSRQKRNDAFQSLKTLGHKKIVQLMDASEYISRLEAELQRLEGELEEARKEMVTWVHWAETFKAERYVRQPEFWGGVVGLVTLFTAVYAVDMNLGDQAAAVSLFLH